MFSIGPESMKLDKAITGDSQIRILNIRLGFWLKMELSVKGIIERAATNKTKCGMYRTNHI